MTLKDVLYMKETRKVILSFDDGPAPEKALNTILNVLASNAIKAEFYVLGSEVKKHPDAAKSIVIGGHSIQNHSWSHPNLAKAKESTVKTELEKTQQVIKEVTGVKTTRVRPPYGAGGWPGKYDAELARVSSKLSMTIHNWDIDTEDWKAPRGIGKMKIAMLKKQLDTKKTKNTLNILMHVQDETARDLSEFIKYLKQSGFSFAVPTK